MKNNTVLFQALLILFILPATGAEYKTIFEKPGADEMPRIPMLLRENRGQLCDADQRSVDRVLYYHQQAGLHVYLTTEGLTYYYYKAATAENILTKSDQPTSIPVQWERVDMRLSGATI